MRICIQPWLATKSTCHVSVTFRRKCIKWPSHFRVTITYLHGILYVSVCICRILKSCMRIRRSFFNRICICLCRSGYYMHICFCRSVYHMRICLCRSVYLHAYMDSFQLETYTITGIHFMQIRKYLCMSGYNYTDPLTTETSADR